MLRDVGLLDALLVLAVVDVGCRSHLVVAHLRRRAELLDESGREVGPEVLSMVVREVGCRAP